MRIEINNIAVEPLEGQTLIEVARGAGFSIPSLCYAQGAEHKSSCMVCAVLNCDNGQVLPSCSTMPTDGMRIDTQSPEIETLRRISLELLLSDHRADCEAPCKVACPGGFDVAKMNRLYEQGKHDLALNSLREVLVIPATLCYICNAPCEKICRKGDIDESVKIREIKRKLVDSGDLSKIIRGESNGVGVAVIGSDPAALSAASRLRMLGYEVRVYLAGAASDLEDGEVLDFTSQYRDAGVPGEVIEREIEAIERTGVEFEVDFGLFRSDDFKAVLCTAEIEVEQSWFVLESKAKQPARMVSQGRKLAEQLHEAVSVAFGSSVVSGISVNSGLSVISELSVPPDLSVASGSSVVSGLSVNSWLSVASEKRPSTRLSENATQKRFNSTYSRFTEAEKLAIATAQRTLAANKTGCLYCDCDSKDDCRLRDYATEYGVKSGKYSKTTPSLAMQRRVINGVINFEQSKCISCGLCVYNTSNGFTFRDRGFGMQVVLPAENEPNVTTKVAQLCPTGALSTQWP